MNDPAIPDQIVKNPEMRRKHWIRISTEKATRIAVAHIFSTSRGKSTNGGNTPFTTGPSSTSKSTEEWKESFRTDRAYGQK